MKRGASPLTRKPVRRLLSSSSAPLLQNDLSPTGVLTLTFNQPEKLNAWTLPLLNKLFYGLADATTDPAVKGVVITGSGKYYSAGADLSAMIKPMAPSSLIRQIRDRNQRLFACFLDFPKPIVAAVNGPAIGAAVTSTCLMDACFASPAATFSLPFAKLGVPPEGCSSVTFPERMGEAAAHRMLGEENWVPSAAEARDAGLVREVVEPHELVARASRFVEERIAAGGGRCFDEAEHERLRRVNAEESATLANAFVSPKFLGAMEAFNAKRKKTQLTRVFWIANSTLPLWRPSDIEANFGFRLDGPDGHIERDH
ncbi:enoyl-CoA hydratase, partial [Emiliania huxleyi CCMP1516]|uniref:Uncharacterized protein n=2 Tax=Emiliania huxleyi TaxID=2903 RepID=A0A0D3K0F8_EMIH1